MKKKKMAKRIDYPVVIFLQVNRINKLLSNIESNWEGVQHLDNAIFGLEANIRTKTTDSDIDTAELDAKNKEIESLMGGKLNSDRLRKIIQKLKEKYIELNVLIEKIGIAGAYVSDAHEY